jgi:polyhydroxybutyrate depolymerase
MAWWARQAGCGTSPSPQRVAADTVLLRFPCPGRAAVDLYRIDGGGHTWPGRDIRGTGPTLVRPGPESPLVANDLIWRFFEAHPLDP